MPGLRLAGEADVLALAHALRDGDIHLPLAHLHLAVVADLGGPERDGAGGALIGIFEIDQDPRVMVLAARPEFTRGGAAAAAAEQRFEEIAEIALAEPFPTAEFEPRIPPRRRPELLARLEPLAELVVGRALLGISSALRELLKSP